MCTEPRMHAHLVGAWPHWAPTSGVSTGPSEACVCYPIDILVQVTEPSLFLSLSLTTHSSLCSCPAWPRGDGLVAVADTCNRSVSVCAPGRHGRASGLANLLGASPTRAARTTTRTDLVKRRVASRKRTCRGDLKHRRIVPAAQASGGGPEVGRAVCPVGAACAPTQGRGGGRAGVGGPHAWCMIRPNTYCC